jgi:aryl-alcohol dehydrogenase-like predicted oxidoreductase
MRRWEIAKERGTSMAIVAIAWSLSKPFKTGGKIDISKIERVEEGSQSREFELPKVEVGCKPYFRGYADLEPA